jgi:hypothetical protein
MMLRGVEGMASSASPVPLVETIQKVQNARAVDPLVLEAARRRLRTDADGVAVSLAGVISMKLARDQGVGTPEGAEWLARAKADFRRGLSKAPTDGLTWFRIATLEYLANGANQDFASAMRMGVFTARGNFEAVPLLLAVAAPAWPQLAPEVQNFTLKSIRDQWANEALRSRLNRLAFNEPGRALLNQALGPSTELDRWIEATVTAESARRERLQAAPPS